MAILFLVRNLLSVKTAMAIAEQYKSGHQPIFSVESDSESYYASIAATIPDGIFTLKTLKLNWLFEGVNYLKHLNALREAEKTIAEILEQNCVSELFVHYPVHEKDALYVKVAKQRKIPIIFYEEGSCFYTKKRGRNKTLTNECKFLIKNTTLKLFGVNRGYNVSPDYWYSILPIEIKSASRIRLTYNDLPIGEIKYLFLSRPVSIDFPDISLDNHVAAICSFMAIVPDNETVFIKFHPRETSYSREKILSSVTDKIKHCTIKELIINCSAEDVVYNMQGGVVCGFDSSTLVYGASINSDVLFYSVLALVKDLDSSCELRNLYDVYTNDFVHIKFL